MPMAAMLWYKKFKEDLEQEGFEFNPYDPCMANKTVNGKQHTIRFHVDNLMSSHEDKEVNDKFYAWLNDKYGRHGEVTCTRGREHEYLGMKFLFKNGHVEINMREYMEDMIDCFAKEVTSKDKRPTPMERNGFNVDDSEPIDEERKENFHTVVAKGLYACKRGRPDLHTAISYLTTRVLNPNETDWDRLRRLIYYINATKDDVLLLKADNLHVIKWYVDGSFAVHPDMRSHSGGVMTYGKGAPITISRKQ
jgi:hypothetical protein